MKHISKSKEFLGMNRMLEIEQLKFIGKIANIFYEENRYTHKTPLITENARNIEIISK